MPQLFPACRLRFKMSGIRSKRPKARFRGNRWVNCPIGKREMQDIPTDTKNRAPSSRVLEEVIRQAPVGYVTIGWLTSTLHRHSFGIIMLSLGLLATTPVGSTVPALILAIMAVQLIAGRAEPVFPHFIMTRRLPTKQLLWLCDRAIHVLKYLEKAVHPRWPMTFEMAKRAV